MIVRHVALKAELVEQRLLRHPPLAHHRTALHPRTTESGLHTRSNDDFFNDIGADLTTWAHRSALVLMQRSLHRPAGVFVTADPYVLRLKAESFRNREHRSIGLRVRRLCSWRVEPETEEFASYNFHGRVISTTILSGADVDFLQPQKLNAVAGPSIMPERVVSMLRS